MDSESECDDGFYDHRVPTAESDLSGPEEFDYETERDFAPSPIWLQPTLLVDKLLQLGLTDPRKTYRNSAQERIFGDGIDDDQLDEFITEEIEYCGQTWDSTAWLLIGRFFEGKTLVQQQLDSFNYFLETDLSRIVTDGLSITIIKDILHVKELANEQVKCMFKFGKVTLEKPKIYEGSGSEHATTPHECRLRNLTYESYLYIDVKETIYSYNSDRSVTKNYKNVPFGTIPLMVKSSFCALYGMTGKETASCLECPMDPGGYFIVNGSEKVIIAQERLALNQVLVFAMTSSKYSYRAEIYSSLENYYYSARYFSVNISARHKEVLGRPSVGRPVMVILPYVKQEIPVFVLFRALGCISDQEILSYISPEVNKQNEIIDSEVTSYLEASIDQAFPIQTQEAALSFIGSRALKPGVLKQARIDNAKNILAKYFLPSLGMTADTFSQKLFFLGYMVHRLLAVALGRRDVDDRDHYGNKRLDMVGPLFSVLFRTLFTKVRREMTTYVQQRLDKGRTWDVALAVRPKTIADGLKYSLSTGNWSDAKSGGQRTGISQVLNRVSYLATISQLRRLVTPINKESRASRPRQLHNTQWGFVCPCETPEGMSVGLVKNLALMACVTVDSGPQRILDVLGEHNLEVLAELSPTAIGKATKIFINGVWIGVHRKPEDLLQTLRNQRRNGQLGHQVSIARNHQHREIRISTDAGRVCRPLLVVEKHGHVTNLALKKSHIIALTEKFSRTNWRDLLDGGIVEYIDANEEENIFCAMYPDQLNVPSTVRSEGTAFTHCEMHPSMILGVCASIIPFPDHNQSPRNTYQAAMAKQAIGVYASSFRKRHDIASHVLYYPQKPLVNSKTMALFRHDDLPSGINCVVAVASYTGYNQEDSIIMNTSSIQRGLFRHTFYRSYLAEERVPARGQVERIELPNPDACQGMRPVMYAKLDGQGIVALDERVSGGDAIIGKTVEYRNFGANDIHSDGNQEPTTKKDASVFLRTAETGLVDEVLLSQSGTGYRFCKVRVRSVRQPVMGDKFASRHGQKGTIGICYNMEDMPFTIEGIVPDIIINPHAIPSRMTIGHLVECIVGKAISIPGRNDLREALPDGTPFTKSCEMKIIQAILRESGYQECGNEVMYNGFTGSKFSSQIFIGPTYYQRLKHMVDDKMYSRSRGQVTLLTRQPPEGRLRDGGLRVGEMERDCLISHGASLNLRERLFEVSDPYRVHVCNTCGFIAIANLQRQTFVCRRCKKKNSSVSQVMIPYACKLLFQELMSMGIAPRMLTSD